MWKLAITWGRFPFVRVNNGIPPSVVKQTKYAAMLNSRHAHASSLLKKDVNWSKDGGQFLMKCKLRLVKHEMAARLACKLLYGGIVTVSCCCYINCVLEHVVEGTVVRKCNFPRRSIFLTLLAESLRSFLDQRRLCSQGIFSCQQLLIKNIQTSSIMLTILAVLI